MFHARIGIVVGVCIVGQTAGFAQFLEDDGVHAPTEVFVEERLHGQSVGGELFVRVVILAHIDVLGLVGGKKNLILRRVGLLGVFFAHRYGGEFLGSLVVLGQLFGKLFLTHGAEVEHRLLHVAECLQAIYQLLGILLA